jgi:hypothetical protein
MDLDRDGAAASLSDVARTEQRTFRAVSYGRSGSTLVLWGVATAAGYLGTQYQPAWAALIWPVVWCVGFAGTCVLLGRGGRRLHGARAPQQWRLIAAPAALLGFGFLTTWILGPLDGRQLDAFWPLVFMLGYVVAGLWIGRFFVLCGISVGALTVAGYWLSGPWFALWMAAANGGALIIGGLWLRRAGIRP